MAEINGGEKKREASRTEDGKLKRKQGSFYDGSPAAGDCQINLLLSGKKEGGFGWGLRRRRADIFMLDTVRGNVLRPEPKCIFDDLTTMNEEVRCFLC